MGKQGKPAPAQERAPASPKAVRMGRFFVAAFREVQHDMQNPATRQLAARRVARLFEQHMAADVEEAPPSEPAPESEEPDSVPPPSSDPGGGDL